MKRKKTHDEKLERLIVGACMVDRKIFEDVAKIITKAEMLASYAHQCCWRAFYRMHREGLPFDEPTLADTLYKEKTINEVRYEYVADLHIERYCGHPGHLAEAVVEMYLRRKALAAVELVGNDVATFDGLTLDLVARAKKEIDSLHAECLAAGEEDREDEEETGYVPFPTVHLPPCLADYVLASADALHCDPAYIAGPALVAMGAAIGNSRVIQVKESWHEPAIFWAATVADAGTMKSPSYDLAIAPLGELQDEMSKTYESEWARYRDEYEDWQSKRYSKFGNRSDDEDLKKPVKPVPKKIIVSDITIEKLAHVLHENPHGVCLCREELSGWFSSFGRYSDGKGVGADMSLWLQLFGARALRVDRKTGDPPSISIRRASCSVTGTIQPKILRRQLSDEFFESGLVSRLLLIMPPRRAKEWTENIVPEQAYRAYSDAVKEIYRTGEDILDWGGGEPMKITFSKAGKEAWIEFYKEWAKRQRDAEGDFVSVLAKLEAYCARFCLLLSVADKHSSPSNRDIIKASHVEDAFGLVNWFAAETQRVYARLRTPADQEARDRLVELIQGRDGLITPSELRRSNPKKYVEPDDAAKALQGLVEKGLGSWVYKTPGKDGGRPTKAFQLSLAVTKTSGN